MLVDDEAFEVAGEQDDRRDGTVVNRYSLNRRRSSSLGGEAIARCNARPLMGFDLRV